MCPESIAKSIVAACAAMIVCIATPSSGDDSPARPQNPYAGKKEIATEGASLLNQYCSHCHGQWAEQAERPRDLRRLRIRYGENATYMFWSTVHSGRLDKGMPNWSGVLEDDTLWRIYTFLETVQEEE